MAIVVVVVLLLGGAAIRLVRIGDPPVAFQATRQYNDALLARKYTEALGGNVGGLSRDVIRAAAPAEIEPPVLELVTAVTWRSTGSEPLWVPRVVSIILWTIGGWLLFLLLRRLASAVAGVAAVAIWTFLPFGVDASRTFQPDPAMTVAIVAATLALVVEDDERTRTRLVGAGLAGGLAVFLKTPAVFYVAPVFAVLTYRRGRWRAFWSKRSAIYASLVATPTILWYAWGLWIAGFLRGQEGGRIEPDLLLHQSFWRGWADINGRAFGLVVPAVTVLGIIAAQGRARQVGIALITGYAMFGLVFTYHYMTHDYYHLPFVFVAAVGIGLLTDAALAALRARRSRHRTATVACVAAAVVIGIFALVEPTRYGLIPDAVGAELRRSEIDAPIAVGDVIDHSANTAFLAPNYGQPAMYYGGFAGTSWPSGDADIRDTERTLAAIRRDHPVDFFVVTDLDAWKASRNLRRVVGRHPLLASGPGYRVYDLR